MLWRGEEKKGRNERDMKEDSLLVLNGLKG